MNKLDTFFDKKYAKYKNRLHRVYSQLYRTQIYTEYLDYKKHKNFHFNDGILKINGFLKKIQKYSKNDPKIVEELLQFTKKNPKRFVISLFLKMYSTWRFLKNHGFILSSLSKYFFSLSLRRIWKVKKKRYKNYIRTSFGSRRYTKRYFFTKGFPMKTLDDVRCWLFYFKKLSRTNISLHLEQKHFIFYKNQKLNLKLFSKYNCLNYILLKNINNRFLLKKFFFNQNGVNSIVTLNFLKTDDVNNIFSFLCSKWFSLSFFYDNISLGFLKKIKFLTFYINSFMKSLVEIKNLVEILNSSVLLFSFLNKNKLQNMFLFFKYLTIPEYSNLRGLGTADKKTLSFVNLMISNFFLENSLLDTKNIIGYLEK